MPRPRAARRICFSPTATFFKPKGRPLRQLKIVEITMEELEALRLKNQENLTQEEAAQKMKTSQSTFQRILTSAYQKITDALINGKAIKITRV